MVPQDHPAHPLHHVLVADIIVLIVEHLLQVLMLSCIQTWMTQQLTNIMLDK